VPLNADDPPERFVEWPIGPFQPPATPGSTGRRGRRYSHIIDPRTGDRSGRSSVTVIAPRGAVADGWHSRQCARVPTRRSISSKRYPGPKLLMVAEDDAGQQRTVEVARL